MLPTIGSLRHFGRGLNGRKRCAATGTESQKADNKSSHRATIRDVAEFRYFRLDLYAAQLVPPEPGASSTEASSPDDVDPSGLPVFVTTAPSTVAVCASEDEARSLPPSVREITPLLSLVLAHAQSRAATHSLRLAMPGSEPIDQT